MEEKVRWLAGRCKAGIKILDSPRRSDLQSATPSSPPRRIVIGDYYYPLGVSTISISTPVTTNADVRGERLSPEQRSPIVARVFTGREIDRQIAIDEAVLQKRDGNSGASRRAHGTTAKVL